MVNTSLIQSINDALKKEYIMYHHSHYTQGLQGKVNGYLSPLWTQAQSNIQSKVVMQKLNSRTAAIKAKGQNGASVFEFLADLRNGAVVDELLRGVAESLVSSVNSVVMMDFNTVAKSAQGYAGIFAGGKAQARDVQAFFDIVTQGIQIMTGGQVPSEVFGRLTGIGKILSNGDFSYSGEGSEITSLTESQLEAIDKVVTYMENAANKFQSKGGSLSRASMRGTLMNIFPNTLRQQLGMQLVEQALPDIQAEVNKISKQMLTGTKVEQVGGASTKKKTHGSVAADVAFIDGQLLNLRIKAKGSTVELSLNTNITGELAKQAVVNSQGHISLGSISVGDILNSFDAAPRGIAYNVFGHKAVDEIGYQRLRSTLSAHFLSQWVDGNVGLSYDKTQYWLVGDQLLDTPSFVASLAKDMPYGQYNSSQLSIDMTELLSTVNSWYGSYPDREKGAQERSRRVQNAVNNLVLKGMVHI